MTVLRPDKPILYHFERPSEPIIQGIQFLTIRKVYYLLWTIAPLLGAIAFPSVKPYMAIAAGVMAALLLVFAWDTRKFGKEL
jgi:hypothetical protein